MGKAPDFAKKWSPQFTEEDLDMKRMPIWVQLRKIPLQYFHPKGISYIASVIGRPLYMDRATAIRSRLDYAKVALVAAPAAPIAEVHCTEVEEEPKCAAPNPVTEEESRAAAATPATTAHIVSFSGTMVKSGDGLSADSIRNRKKAPFTEEVIADLEEEEDNHGSEFSSADEGENSNKEKALARNISHSCVLMGDFNAVKDIQEVKAVGREVVIDQSMRDFADFLNSTELTDHTSIGCYYTWSNKRQEGFQARKIDRVLINEKWVQNSIKKEMDLRVKLLEATDRQEKFLKQKSRVAWLKAGDQNTSFFHKTVKGRNARSTIRALFSTSGVKLEGVQEIKDEAINYYQGLLGRKDDCIGRVSTSQLSSILKKKVPHPKLQMLMSPIAEEEIKTTLFSMGNDKSPGLDGFTAFFYKHAWQVVRRDFIRAVLANRLKGVFLDIISLNQTAFVQGQRGVRQGDPLSPYLFVIGMEVFSHLMDLAAAEGRIGFHPRCTEAEEALQSRRAIVTVAVAIPQAVALVATIRQPRSPVPLPGLRGKDPIQGVWSSRDSPSPARRASKDHLRSSSSSLSPAGKKGLVNYDDVSRK
ncbi:hypothetical protein CRG98_005535, partial [Punica granatum]